MPGTGPTTENINSEKNTQKPCPCATCIQEGGAETKCLGVRIC